MGQFSNPFRPGAGHSPPYLAGRQAERGQFLRLLDQQTILKNIILTGLRGVGKTVLLDTLKPLAIERGWLWVSANLSESASIKEDSIASRLCIDIATLTSNIVINSKTRQSVGFASATEQVNATLNYDALWSIYTITPGLALDKIKKVIEIAWQVIAAAQQPRGIIFAYDEAQNLANHATEQQYPLSVLLDTFQSIQKQDIPAMLVFAGLPTLFPNLVEARTFSERMFRVVFLQSLAPEESKNAILKPLADSACPLQLTDESVQEIVQMSGGYPYFIQFICKEVYDVFVQKAESGERASVPVREIEYKLDTDFFAGRWARTTDRQRELLVVIAHLENCDAEFSVQQVVERAKQNLRNPFSNSRINQMLKDLINKGLIFRNRRGRYSFAVPLFGRFIRRQERHDSL